MWKRVDCVWRISHGFGFLLWRREEDTAVHQDFDTCEAEARWMSGTCEKIVSNTSPWICISSMVFYSHCLALCSGRDSGYGIWRSHFVFSCTHHQVHVALQINLFIIRNYRVYTFSDKSFLFY
ncbi:hypothetical protein ACJIZ3_010320 [Penstemon smallii]|uniref:Uncharacterized protein n=1 Tax=Penstemon smallii TaxID=265156 RepID=A0ABD3TEZ2_9LAMI